MCQSACAKCHLSILNRHYHLAEVETHRSVPIPFRSDQLFGRYSRKRLKLRIVPIAIDMCQVPPIDSRQAQSPSRGRNTSISAPPIPIIPAVRTLFAKRLTIRTKEYANRHVPSATDRFSRHHHLPEVETHRLVLLPFRSDQPFGRYARKG